MDWYKPLVNDESCKVERGCLSWDELTEADRRYRYAQTEAEKSKATRNVIVWPLYA